MAHSVDNVCYDEEQDNEIEALESIYYNEFMLIGKNPSSYIIHVTYQDTPDDPLLTNFPAIDLRIKYTDKYPDEIPIFELVNPVNMPNDLVVKMEKKLLEVANKCIGTIMVYDLVITIQEMINDYTDSWRKQQKGGFDEKVETKDSKQENSDYEKSEGARITPETFNAWKEQFDIEMGIIELCIDDKERRLTGRELFQTDKSLCVSDLDFIENDDEISSLDVNEGLFVSKQESDLDPVQATGDKDAIFSENIGVGSIDDELFKTDE